MIGRYIDLGNPVANHPLNEGLVAWWLPLPNNQGGGTLFDLRNSASGTLTNGATWTTGPNGFAALSFNSAFTSYVACPTVPITGEVTISCWVNLATAGSAQMFVDKNTTNTEFNLFVAANMVNVRGGSTTAAQATEPSAGTWHHLVGTVGTGGVGSTPLSVYVDGALGGTEAGGSPPYGNTGTVELGRYGSFGGGFYLTGYMTDVRIQSRALSAADVAALYDQSLRGHPDTLRRWSRKAWSFGTSGGGGGTEYSQDNSGSSTPTGVLTKLITKTLAGSITPSGALTKLVTSALAGSLTSAGTLTKTVSKALAGSSTPTGASTNSTSKAASSSCTPTGASSQQCSKPLAGSSTPSGEASNIKVALQSLGGSLTITGAYTAAVSKSLNGSATPAGSLAKLVTKPASGSCTPVGNEEHTKAILQSLSGSLTPSGAQVRLILKALAGSVTITGSLSTSGGSSLAYPSVILQGNAQRHVEATNNVQRSVEMTGQARAGA